jgi:hypothetical protein
VTAKAKVLHQKSLLPKSTARQKSLGFAVEAIERCLEYVKGKPPIAIPFKRDLLETLLNGTHYSNVQASDMNEGKAAKERERERKRDVW